MSIELKYVDCLILCTHCLLFCSPECQPVQNDMEKEREQRVSERRENQNQQIQTESQSHFIRT